MSKPPVKKHPPEIRAAILKAMADRNMSGLSVPQIAAQFGVPKATVHTMWHYAKKGTIKKAPAPRPPPRKQGNSDPLTGALDFWEQHPALHTAMKKVWNGEEIQLRIHKKDITEVVLFHVPLRLAGDYYVLSANGGPGTSRGGQSDDD